MSEIKRRRNYGEEGLVLRYDKIRKFNRTDINFYNDIKIDSNYCNVRDFPSDFNSFSDSHFSILSLNIRSMNKNFENFRFMLNKMEYKFKLMSY